MIVAKFLYGKSTDRVSPAGGLARASHW